MLNRQFSERNEFKNDILVITLWRKDNIRSQDIGLKSLEDKIV